MKGLVTALVVSSLVVVLCPLSLWAQEHSPNQLEGAVQEAGARAGFASGDEVRAAHQHEEASGHGEHHGPPPVNWVDTDYTSKNVNGGELEKGEAPMAPPLLFALVNFGLFAWLLFGKIPIGKKRIGLGVAELLRKTFREKHDTIKSALEEAARLRQEAADKLEEYNQRIKDVDAEVNAVITNLRADAEAERKRILEDAEAQAVRTKKEAESRIAAEIAAAKRTLEREVAAAATKAAAAILEQRAKSEQHRLVDQFLAELKDAPSTTEEPQV